MATHRSERCAMRRSCAREARGFRGGNRLAILAAAVVLMSVCPAAFAGPKGPAFLPAQGSTSPSNGDLNPYGLARVPGGFPGPLQAGQLLVSNFNNSLDDGNVQGEGSTIVTMDPNTGQQVGLPFFQGTPPIGFTNALGIVKAGFVFAGSVFTENAGSPGQNGGLLVIDHTGTLVMTIMDGTNGPWGLAVEDEGNSALLFVSNVLAGTITRMAVSFQHGVPTVGSPTTIASGYAFGPDDAGLVVGPAGLVYDDMKDVLYVASEDDNAIFKIDHAGTLQSSAGTGTQIFADANHLHGPLGLMIAPNGNFITANADPDAHVDPLQPSELVEFTPGGTFVRQFSIDSSTGGAFAILNTQSGPTNQFAYVDDVPSTLTILTLSNIPGFLK